MATLVEKDKCRFVTFTLQEAVQDQVVTTYAFVEHCIVREQFINHQFDLAIKAGCGRILERDF